MSVEWRPIAEFPRYEVSSDGQVRRVLPTKGSRVGLVLRPFVTNVGYPCVALRDGKRAHKRTIHKLVCTAFHGPPPSDQHEVAHNDGDRSNPRANNLRWATRQENMADTFRHGTHVRGLRHPLARLSDDQVREILEVKRAPGIQSRIAEKFGVSVSLISLIRLGQHRAYVKESSNA